MKTWLIRNRRPFLLLVLLQKTDLCRPVRARGDLQRHMDNRLRLLQKPGHLYNTFLRCHFKPIFKVCNQLLEIRALVSSNMEFCSKNPTFCGSFSGMSLLMDGYLKMTRHKERVRANKSKQSVRKVTCL